MHDSLRHVHARSVRNALAGNLSPSLTACDTSPRWPCIRWLIGALLLLAFCPQVFIRELIYRWPLGYRPPITVLGDLPLTSLPTGLSVATWLLTTDHFFGWSAPWSLCQLADVSPYEWSTWLSSADVIYHRWPTGSRFMIKSALRRFKCLGSLNSAENVGTGVRTFGKFSRNTIVACSSLEVTHKGLGNDLCQNEKIHTRHSFLLPPSECHTRCSDLGWVLA